MLWLYVVVFGVVFFYALPHITIRRLFSVLNKKTLNFIMLKFKETNNTYLHNTNTYPHVRPHKLYIFTIGTLSKVHKHKLYSIYTIRYRDAMLYQRNTQEGKC